MDQLVIVTTNPNAPKWWRREKGKWNQVTRKPNENQRSSGRKNMNTNGQVRVTQGHAKFTFSHSFERTACTIFVKSCSRASTTRTWPPFRAIDTQDLRTGVRFISLSRATLLPSEKNGNSGVEVGKCLLELLATPVSVRTPGDISLIFVYQFLCPNTWWWLWYFLINVCSSLLLPVCLMLLSLLLWILFLLVCHYIQELRLFWLFLLLIVSH